MCLSVTCLFHTSALSLHFLLEDQRMTPSDQTRWLVCGDQTRGQVGIRKPVRSSRKNPHAQDVGWTLEAAMQERDGVDSGLY